MTDQLFRADAYLKECDAKVVAVNDRGGIVLDRTVFYASSGGQPGDAGVLETAGSAPCPITTTVWGADKVAIAHLAPEGAPRPELGQSVRARLDWDTRYQHMRMHTALHLLCSLVKFPVTGGQIGAQEGRLDFDIADPSGVDKERLTAEINALVAANQPVSERWITDAELEANPHLVRTMAVKPPTGTGKVRLVVIGENGAVDLQPCGGTHVRTTSEIGRLAVARIENKGKQNRRIRLVFV